MCILGWASARLSTKEALAADSASALARCSRDAVYDITFATSADDLTVTMVPSFNTTVVNCVYIKEVSRTRRKKVKKVFR